MILQSEKKIANLKRYREETVKNQNTSSECVKVNKGTSHECMMSTDREMEASLQAAVAHREERGTESREDFYCFIYCILYSSSSFFSYNYIFCFIIFFIMMTFYLYYYDNDNIIRALGYRAPSTDYVNEIIQEISRLLFHL